MNCTHIASKCIYIQLNCTHKTIDLKGYFSKLIQKMIMFKTRIKLWLIQFRNVMKKDGNTKQLTVLVDVDELKDFQSVCRNQDMNSSQVIRMFIRDYIKKYGKQESKKWIN